MSKIPNQKLFRRFDVNGKFTGLNNKIINNKLNTLNNKRKKVYMFC